MDESLRWLLANGKNEEAKKVMRRMARVNNKSEDKILEVYNISTLCYHYGISAKMQLIYPRKHKNEVYLTKLSDQKSALGFLR